MLGPSRSADCGEWCSRVVVDDRSSGHEVVAAGAIVSTMAVQEVREHGLQEV